MCGLLGMFCLGGIDPDQADFKRALSLLERRGPDDSGIWQDDHARLGLQRLAIVDLSPCGHQPMVSGDRRFVIAFNGEIYNHQELRARLNPHSGWHGTSDTETLLEAYRTWGAECLQHLNGMFAFAIWDKIERTMFLARDRMGVKPLYYSAREGTFAFASRPGALAVALGDTTLDVNPEALRIYLELGYVPAPLSFHGSMRKVPPGNYIIANSRGVRVVRYWDFRSIAPDTTMSCRPEDDLVEELDALIRSAVKLRLMSDVPLGAFLSGGVDSAVIVASMKAAGVERPKAFTIAFKEKKYDEGEAAAAVARDLGVEHVRETLDSDSLLDLLPMYIDQYDEPFSDSSAFPTMAVARLAHQHVTVALTGDGADELFGGYHYYPLINKLDALTHWRAITKRFAGRLFSAIPLHRAKLLAGAVKCADTVELFNYLRSVSKDYPELVSEGILRTTSSSKSWFAQYAADFAMDLSASETAMRLDSGFTLPDLFLQKVDIATMAYSLEARCPMTDYRLVEWAMRLPAHFKYRDGESKYLLKKVACRYLSKDRVYRPKMGFGVPIAQWLRGPLRDWAEALLYDETLMLRVPLSRERVRDLWRQYISGRREAHPLLWSVLMLLCFVQKHQASRSLRVPSYREVA
jgi:asparagine synthase (glutamine-hydrolysing)